ncbi:hypothetical protein B566_EDAN011209 [Ephemera danica]|nr:hypothetical protein B566_EDAN011209 [Ephemera danica]
MNLLGDLCPSCVNQHCTREAKDQGFNVMHPVYCTKFCKCNIGGAVEFVCPDGLHFNTQTGTCDWPNSAQCQNTPPFENCRT